MAIAAGFLLAMVPSAAQAQFLLGPEAAYHDDHGFGVGAAIELDPPRVSPGVGFLGDFLIFFPDDDPVAYDYFEFNANLTYDVPLEDTNVVPFGIAGVNIGRTSTDVDSPGIEGRSDTDLAFNIGGGAAFQAGSFRPRVGVRVAIGDATGVVVFGILPFRVAGGS